MTLKIKVTVAISLLFVSIIAGCIFTNALAQNINDDPRFKETLKKSQKFSPHYSSDTTPVEFSVGDVHYKVPRNYIINMDNYDGGPQTLVAFKVTFPGFEPYSDKTKDCLTKVPAYRPQGCIPIVFNVIGKTEVSDDEAFNNAKKGTHKVEDSNKPLYGFEMYEVGPDTARTEIYGKQGTDHVLLIECLIVNGNKEIPVCGNNSRLPNGNGVNYKLNGSRYFFNGDQLKYAEQVDDGLRSLIKSFTLV